MLSPQGNTCGLNPEVEAMRTFPFEWRSIDAMCALALAGCQAAEQSRPAPVEHYRGRLTSGCAPNGAPSNILQSATGTRQVSFHLWPASPWSIPGEARFEGGHAEGLAACCNGPDACQPAVFHLAPVH